MAAKVIVFDFDGVILESADIKTTAFVELFAEHRAHVESIRRHHLANLGVSRFKKFEWIYRELLGLPYTDEVRDELGTRFQNLVFEKVLAAPFVPGAKEALDTFHGRVRMFVASGTPEEELKVIVERRGLSAFFESVHGSPTEKSAVIRTILGAGTPREDILFIGDGESDYRAAETTGVRFIARDTPELHDMWIKTGLPLIPDLHALPTLVWKPTAPIRPPFSPGSSP